jgi:twinkle protein|tara:strand:- start:1803 stop:3365 length:1563 start_codon:yes stop_codon:yes gene_type:complete
MGSEHKKHQSCPNCGSSDGLFNYDDGPYCHVCKLKTFTEEGSEPMQALASVKALPPMTGTASAIPSRGLVKAVAEKYRALTSGNEVKLIYTLNGKPTGFKQRGLVEKTFRFNGNAKADLFGQSAFSKGGKSVTITEGEFDAMAAYQMMFMSEPCVSVINGASGAVQDCKRNYEWLDSFDKINVCFDNDVAGQNAALAVAELFDPRKVRLVKMVLNDPNDYITQSREREFIDSHKSAGPFTPDGIIAGADMYEIVSTFPSLDSVEYPFLGLNDMTKGMRTGELITFVAGTGVGKTQVMREILYSLIKADKGSVGTLFLEEPTRDTGLGVMSLHANKKLHLPDTEYTQDEFDEAYKATLGSNRVYLYDSFGSNTVERIISMVRFLARSCECKFIILDHISIVVSDHAKDERKALDEIVTKLKTLTIELDICLMMVSHLSRDKNRKPPEEGGTINLQDIRGTAGIAQLSNIIIALERNTQAEDEIERNTTKVRVIKNRFTGETGVADSLLYSKHSGRLTSYGG